MNALGDVADLDVIDLGCGTGYFSAWLAKRGARPVGIDPTPAQLETAREMQREFGLDFPLLEGVAESVPLPDASFDLALSEYGARSGPTRTAGYRRPLGSFEPADGSCSCATRRSPSLTMDLEGSTEQLQRPQRGLGRLEWPDTHEVEFHLPHGELIDLLRANGFDIERLIELYAPEGAKTHEYYGYVAADWARKWPAEEIWIARKR